MKATFHFAHISAQAARLELDAIYAVPQVFHICLKAPGVTLKPDDNCLDLRHIASQGSHITFDERDSVIELQKDISRCQFGSCLVSMHELS